MLNNFEFKKFKEEIEQNYPTFIYELQNSSNNNYHEQSMLSTELSQSIKTPVNFNQLGIMHLNYSDS